MKLLKDIPSNLFISIDVETIRLVENYKDLDENHKIAWDYKMKQEKAGITDEEISELWETKAAFFAEFSKLCAVSLCFLNKAEDKLMCKTFCGPDESIILTELGEYLNKINSSGIKYRLIGHAAKFFDYPYMCKRFIIMGLDIPEILDTAHLKPWESRNLCTNMDVWKMGGTGSGASLLAICVALDIPISKDNMSGGEVGTYYFSGKTDEIGVYCSKDVVATFNVIRKIKKEEIFLFESVVHI